MRQDAGVDGDAQRISQLCWMFFLKILDDQDQQLELMDSTLHAHRCPSGLRWGTWAANPEGITGDELLGFINNDLFPTLKELTPPGPQAHRQRVVRERLRGRLQLHEVGSAAPPGGQQDQRDRLQQPRREAALRRRLRADPQRPPERRQCGRVLHAARGHDVHGASGSTPSPARSSSTPHAGPAASSPARSATCASSTSRRPRTRS